MSKAGVGTFVLEDHEQASSGLDLFSGPQIDMSLNHGKTLTIYPSSTLTDNGPFDFIVPNDGQDFIDLPYTRLNGCIEITQKDGSAITDTEVVSFCNLLPQSIFRQLEVSINNQQISDLSTPTYAYKSYIETLLSFPDEVKKTTLVLEHFTKDTLGLENSNKLTTASFALRHAQIKKGKIHFSMLLHSDFFHSNKLLLPGCELKLKFIRSEDNFSLMCDTSIGKIKIHDLTLNVRKITVEPAIVDRIESVLSSDKPAIYPIAQSRIKTFTLSKDSKNERVNNVFRGILPRSVIVTFVKTKAYDGDITQNPFCFSPFDLNSFQAYINGTPVLGEPFQPDFDKNNFYREYRWFMDNLGWAHDMNSNGVTMEEYKTNSFFLPFDLSPDLTNGASMSPIKEGSVDFHVGFSKNLPHNVTMIVYATFNEILAIDKERNIVIT